MKTKIFSAALLLMVSAAQAQQIGGVTLSAPRSYSKQKVSLPADWYQIRGNITADGRISLPKGSTVSVTMINRSIGNQVVRIDFKNSALPTNYYMAINPIRINSKHHYTLQAVISDPSGKMLYRSAEVVLGKNVHTVHLKVR